MKIKRLDKTLSIGIFIALQSRKQRNSSASRETKTHFFFGHIPSLVSLGNEELFCFRLRLCSAMYPIERKLNMACILPDL